jgi:hypothetical protein
VIREDPFNFEKYFSKEMILQVKSRMESHEDILRNTKQDILENLENGAILLIFKEQINGIFRV